MDQNGYPGMQSLSYNKYVNIRHLKSSSCSLFFSRCFKYSKVVASLFLFVDILVGAYQSDTVVLLRYEINVFH